MRPSFLAVSTLMTSSNLDACTNGKAALSVGNTEASGKGKKEYQPDYRRQREAILAPDQYRRGFRHTQVCVFASPLAELIATMRHHAETPATMIADLMLADFRLPHHTLAQQFDGISLR